MTCSADRDCSLPSPETVVSPGMSNHRGVSSMFPMLDSEYFLSMRSFRVLMMKLTTGGTRPAGSLWLTVVLRRTDRQWRLKNFCNYPLLARKSSFPCSWVISSALRWIALQVTCRFSVLISSIHRIRISGSAAFDQPHPAAYSSLGVSSVHLLLFPFSNSFLINSMYSSSRSVWMLRGIVNNLQLKCCVERLRSSHSVATSGHARAWICRHTPDSIINIIKCSVYSREATISLRLPLSTALIRGRLLNGVRRPFE